MERVVGGLSFRLKCSKANSSGEKSLTLLKDFSILFQLNNNQIFVLNSKFRRK